MVVHWALKVEAFRLWHSFGMDRGISRARSAGLENLRPSNSYLHVLGFYGCSWKFKNALDKPNPFSQCFSLFAPVTVKSLSKLWLRTWITQL
jgi:hypothetical protein